MAKELYTVLVNDEGILENPVASKFLKSNNLVTKDEVSNLVEDTGVVAFPKDTGYAAYPNKVGSKGWYVNRVTICESTDPINGIKEPNMYAWLELSDKPTAKLSGKKITNGSNPGTLSIDSDDSSYLTDDYGPGVSGLSVGDHLTIVSQACNLNGLTGNGAQLQGLLRVVGPGHDTTAAACVVVELDTDFEGYTDTVFKRNEGTLSFANIFYAWFAGQDNEVVTKEKTKATKPEENTVRVYGKPEIGAVEIITSSMVAGVNCEASGQGAISLGRQNQVTATAALAAGRNNVVPGYASAALGHGNQVYGEKDFAFGAENKVYGLYNTAIGNANTVGNKDNGAFSYNLAVGYTNTIGSAIGALTVGQKNNIDANYSVAFGDLNIVGSTYSFALGSNNDVGNDSQTSLNFVIGNGNEIVGSNNFIFGSDINITTNNVFIKGNNNKIDSASASNASIFGHGNTISGNAEAAFVTGVDNISYSKYSIVLGNQNTVSVSGTCCNTIGYNNKISGSAIESTAIGSSNELKHIKAFALGVGLKSNNRDQVIVGNYNDSSKAYTFSVGTGTSDSDRKTSFGVKSDGTFQVPVFDANGNRTSDYATVKVVRASNGSLQMVLS